MEGLVNQVIALSSPGDHAQLITVLRGADGLLAQNQQHILGALQLLDPPAHSLGALYLLHALCKGGLNPQGDGPFIDYVSRFLQVCNGPQIQHAPDLFCALCKRYKEQAMASGNPRRGILPLTCAVRALQHSSEMLTPIHADLFQLCLLARCYNAAAQILSEDIFDVAPAATTCTPTDLFLYCYYGAMICIGRKQHARALELLLQALTAPAVVGNAIVVAAHKKYILTCLIHAGHVLPLPKFTASRVKQAIDSECRAYNDLAQAYASRSPDKLRRAAEQHQQAFVADNNVGLVRQVLPGVTVRAIQRLTQTFLTLSLADIAASVGLASAEEAETHIFRMVAAGQIHAQIDGRSGMVRFAEDGAAGSSAAAAAGGGGSSWDSAEDVAQLDARIRQVLALNTRLQQANDMVSTDRAYLAKVVAKERSKYDVGGGGLGGLGGSLPDDFALAAAAGSGGSQGGTIF